jgi:hypothetical protein
MIEPVESKMTFTYIDCEGIKTTKEFVMSNWVKGLDEYINFLRGCGFMIEKDGVAINESKHPYVTHEDVYNLGTFDL